MFLIKLIIGHKKYGFKFYEKSYPASHLQRDHRYLGGSALILSERPDFRPVGREKWNLLLKTFKMSPQTSPNSLSFTHINFLRLSEIVGQSHCTTAGWVQDFREKDRPVLSEILVGHIWTHISPKSSDSGDYSPGMPVIWNWDYKVPNFLFTEN